MNTIHRDKGSKLCHPRQALSLGEASANKAKPDWHHKCPLPDPNVISGNCTKGAHRSCYNLDCSCPCHKQRGK